MFHKKFHFIKFKELNLSCYEQFYVVVYFFESKQQTAAYVHAGAYPEIFRGRGFEIFLYGRENLGGVLGFFFLKNLSKLKKIPKKGKGFDPQNPSLNTPLCACIL